MPTNLDAIRGLACLLLVAFHVVGGPGSGLRLPNGHAMHLLMEWLAQIRMPIFAALSGYLFAAKLPTRDGLSGFLRGKLTRLGLPLIAATLIYAGLRFALYGDVPQVAWLYSSYLHLWFLQASLVLFLIFGAWTAWMRPGTGALIAAGFVSAVASGLIPWMSVLSVGGALSLAPFFAFGIVARRHLNAVRSADGLIAAGMIAIVLMALEGAALTGWISAAPRSTIAFALCGSAWFALFLRFVPENALLAYIGRASYAIFLWHALSGAGTRIVAQRFGIADPLLLASASYAGALGAPVALSHFARDWPLAALLSGAQRLERQSAVRSPASTRREVLP